jgi:hypothetical protein
VALALKWWLQLSNSAAADNVTVCF